MNQIRSDVKDDIEADVLYAAVGTGITAPTISDTALTSEIFRDVIDEYDKSTTDTITVSLRVLTTEANGYDLAEVGLFESASGGTAQTHDLITSITKTNDIQLYLDSSFQIDVTEG